MDFGTRRPLGLAGFLIASQPSTYLGQWLATHSGSRKFAEIGVQPRFAASVTPFECGATAVTTIGGCGFWAGLVIAPCSISGICVFSVVTWKNCPCSRYGGSPFQMSSTMLIDSRKMALRSFL